MFQHTQSSLFTENKTKESGFRAEAAHARWMRHGDIEHEATRSEKEQHAANLHFHPQLGAATF